VTDGPRRREPELGAALAAALPDDTFALLCGLGGLVLELRLGEDAALWRGHPWGDGWSGGGSRAGLERLVAEVAPAEITVPAGVGLAEGYARGWGWGWHATTAPPPVQPGEAAVGWVPADDELTGLVERGFPHAETPPGDPRVERWFGARADGVLVAAAAALRLAPGAALLSSLTVDPAIRREGWGRAVTGWFVRDRLAAGAVVVGLGTYLGNDPARRLYRRLGLADVPYVGGVSTAGGGR
jgi:ribosomal protein S18 acetylase RimI-like enzyme